MISENRHLSLIANLEKVMTFNYDDLTPEHFSASIDWIAKMSDATKWTLADEEVSLLLGINVAEYAEMRKMAFEGIPFSLRTESAERISLLLHMWKKLNSLGFDEQTSISIFNRPNNSKLLKGKSIKRFLLEGNSLGEFYAVNLYLESISEI